MALENITSADIAAAEQISDTLVGVYIVVGIILLIAFYVYLSFAYQSIARKTKVKPAGIAWVPIVGPLIVASKSSKRNTYPIWLLLIGAIFLAIPFVFTEITWIVTVSLILSLAAFTALSIYSIIWNWYMFKTLRYPGWWSLLSLGGSIGQTANAVLIGIAAWLDR